MVNVLQIQQTQSSFSIHHHLGNAPEVVTVVLAPVVASTKSWGESLAL